MTGAGPQWRHVLLVDDHPLFRAGMTQLVQSAHPQARVTEAGSLAQAIQALRSNDPVPVDLALLDLGLPDAQGVQAVRRLRELAPDLAVTVVSAQADAHLAMACLQAGAMGFIHKSVQAQDFMATVERALRGVNCLPNGVFPATPDARQALVAQARALTSRQKDVLLALLQGGSNKHIARHLGVAESTVKTHVAEVMRCLGVGSRTQAVVALAGVDPDDWR